MIKTSNYDFKNLTSIILCILSLLITELNLLGLILLVSYIIKPIIRPYFFDNKYYILIYKVITYLDIIILLTTVLITPNIFLFIILCISLRLETRD